MSRKVIIGIILALLATAGGWALYPKSKTPVVAEKETKDISNINPDVLKDDFYKTAKDEMKRKDEEIAELKRKMSDIEAKMQEQPKADTPSDSSDTPGDNATDVETDKTPIINQTLPALPPAPDQPVQYQQPPPAPSAQYAVEGAPPAMKAEPVVLGDIAVVSSGGNNKDNPGESDVSESDVKKNKGKRIYLPPSIIPADLLSGLDAHTAQDSDKNPTPALFRIRKLAILPNEVRANLKGCFVLGEGVGRLDSERVEIRLVTLACVDFNGNALIDQTVKGYVVDEDGKVGLRGHMVAKFGSMVARSALAGFVEGIGSATQAAFQDVSVSPQGVVTSTDKTKDVIGAGIGGAVEGAGKQVGRFYLDLAKQTLPIIEVGATKPVSLITTEGVELLLKDEYCIGDESCQEEEEI
jgi:conjugal transfer pilus assembly protein TraB